MNLEEAKHIRYKVSHGEYRVTDFISGEAKGFIEGYSRCLDKMDSLVEVLGMAMKFYVSEGRSGIGWYQKAKEDIKLFNEIKREVEGK